MTDAIIPSITEVTRSTELPAEDDNQKAEKEAVAQLKQLLETPGWRVVETRFQEKIAKYSNPSLDMTMPAEELKSEYIIARTIAGILQETLDDVRRT